MAACEAGLLAVITLPKQTPRKPSPCGMPNVRTAKSFLFGKISTTVGWVSSIPYFLQSEVLARCEQRERVVAIKLRFVRMHSQAEIGVGQRLKLRNGIVERDEIVSDHVVAILLIHVFRQAPAFVFLAQPQEILRELALCRDIRLIRHQSPPLITGTFREPVLLGELQSDEMIDSRVGLPAA